MALHVPALLSGSPPQAWGSIRGPGPVSIGAFCRGARRESRRDLSTGPPPAVLLARAPLRRWTQQAALWTGLDNLFFC
eukprot:9089381-Pyramimonas_sp.AAC.1